MQYLLLVYQDDSSYTPLELAGDAWVAVAKCRKPVSKKIPDEMAKQHIKFVEGCQSYSAISD